MNYINYLFIHHPFFWWK
uniref:Uncharacterized protein n=1 Tax=Rhizophora mucronata TaxID=61149 RepID=A0A2P2R3W6_RHIMU